MKEEPGANAPVGPGETRARVLDRAPGERYAAAGRYSAGSPLRGRPVTAVPPMRARATAAAVAAAVQVSLALGVGIGVFDVRWPLLIVSGVGGWYIGEAAWFGAWNSVTRASGPDARAKMSRVTVGAVAIAFAGWFVGQVIGWFISMWRLQDSALSIGDRLSALPFLDWLAPQFGPLEVVEILLLTGVAWFAARPR